MNDITKQTSIVTSTLASIETILSRKDTIDFFNHKQFRKDSFLARKIKIDKIFIKSFSKERNNVTNSCQSRDMTKRETLSEKEY